MRWAGFDGLIFKGAAQKPVYAYVHDEQVEILDASDRWGLGIHETVRRLRDTAAGRSGGLPRPPTSGRWRRLWIAPT
jgi:aldehyde:ferredoxin oxidoreductase